MKQLLARTARKMYINLLFNSCETLFFKDICDEWDSLGQLTEDRRAKIEVCRVVCNFVA